MSTFTELDSVWRDRSIYPDPCNYQLTTEQIDTWNRSVREVRALPVNPQERPLDFMSDISVTTVTMPYPRIELFANAFIVVDSITGTNIFNTLDPHGLNINDIVMTSAAGFEAANLVRPNVEYHVIATPTPTSFQVSLTQAGPIQLFTNGTGLALVFAVITPADYAIVMGQLTDALQLLDFPCIYLDFHCTRYNDIRAIRSINGVLSDAKFALHREVTLFNGFRMPVWIKFRCHHGEQTMRYKRNDTVAVRFMTRDGSTVNFFTEANLEKVTDPFKQTIITLREVPYTRDAVYTNHLVEPLQ